MYALEFPTCLQSHFQSNFQNILLKKKKRKIDEKYNKAENNPKNQHCERENYTHCTALNTFCLSKRLGKHSISECQDYAQGGKGNR